MKNEMMKHIINCDADPFVPKGWKVEEHKKGGQFAFDPAKVKFYLSRKQKHSEPFYADQLQKELANAPVLNANVLDYLLAYPELIPEDWKKDKQGDARYVFFWGTIYCWGGPSYVRYLYWRDGAWHWYSRWLGDVWFNSDPAAVLAS